MSKTLLTSVVVCSLAVFYFSGIGFDFGIVAKTLTALISFVFLYIAGKGGWQNFYLFTLTTFSTAVSLGCSFLNPTEVTGPFVLNLRLSPFFILVLSLCVGLLALYYDRKNKSKNSFATILLFVFIMNWLILGINVRFYDDWKMENWLTIPFAVLIYITHRWFRLSNISYGLIFAYTMLHIYGSHYTYSEVPFGFWVQNMFDMTRNHYDRIVHFVFGFLLAYPFREITLRISNAKGFWGFWFPIEFILAFSAIYEVIEWWVVGVFGGDIGIAYLGTQGDIWDAQKDMLLAGLGATVAMGVTFFTLWRYRGQEFWKEFWDSFRVKHKKALGEEALEELEKRF